MMLLYFVTQVFCTNLANSMFNHLNKIRKQHDLKLMQSIQNLEGAARDQALYMCENALLTHNNPIGELEDRLIKNGFKGAVMGENIAKNHIDNFDNVVKLWMNSPKHRDNILGQFPYTGIATCLDQFGKRYWVVVFGSEKADSRDEESLSDVEFSEEISNKKKENLKGKKKDMILPKKTFKINNKIKDVESSNNLPDSKLDEKPDEKSSASLSVSSFSSSVRSSLLNPPFAEPNTSTKIVYVTHNVSIEPMTSTKMIYVVTSSVADLPKSYGEGSLFNSYTTPKTIYQTTTVTLTKTDNQNQTQIKVSTEMIQSQSPSTVYSTIEIPITKSVISEAVTRSKAKKKSKKNKKGKEESSSSSSSSSDNQNEIITSTSTLVLTRTVEVQKMKNYTQMKNPHYQEDQSNSISIIQVNIPRSKIPDEIRLDMAENDTKPINLAEKLRNNSYDTRPNKKYKKNRNDIDSDESSKPADKPDRFTDRNPSKNVLDEYSSNFDEDESVTVKPNRRRRSTSFNDYKPNKNNKLTKNMQNSYQEYDQESGDKVEKRNSRNSSPSEIKKYKNNSNKRHKVSQYPIKKLNKAKPRKNDTETKYRDLDYSKETNKIDDEENDLQKGFDIAIHVTPNGRIRTG